MRDSLRLQELLMEEVEYSPEEISDTPRSLIGNQIWYYNLKSLSEWERIHLTETHLIGDKIKKLRAVKERQFFLPNRSYNNRKTFVKL